MSIFRKTVKYSKGSKDLNEKIKNLDENLKKTGVILEQFDGDILYTSSEYEKNISKKEEENELYNWRETFQENNIKEEIFEEEYQYPSLTRVENYITESNRELILIRDQIFKEISEDTLLNLPEIKTKITKVLEIYEKIQEGLLNEPPEIKNEDPLTPLNQEFVTVEDLNKHYNLFINRIQQQLATIGGGGEVRLKYLDDIVGIATNPSNYDGKFLKYNHAIGKFEFANVSGGESGGENYWIKTAVGIHTLSNVGIGTTNPTSSLTVIGNLEISGTSFFNDYVYFNEDNNIIFGYDGATPTGLVIRYNSNIGSQLRNYSNLGGNDRNISLITQYDGDIFIKTGNTNIAVFSGVGLGLTVTGDVRVGVNTSKGVILTSPNGTKYRLVVDDGGNLSTVLVS